MEETSSESINVSAMDRTQLLEAVRKQVEYYFSKENLQSDIFLTSQMDAQMTVPISVVMKFAKLKALTQDESVLREALTESTITTIVDNKIKAHIKPAGRSTIILRDIPTDTPEEEVREIFNFEGCKPIGAIRSDIGDSWFVSMDSEEDAKDTLIDLRLKKRTFRGQSVKARIKTETIIRSFYPLPGAPVMAAGYPAYPAQMPIDLRSFGYNLPHVEVVASADGSAATAAEKSPEDQKNATKANAASKDNRVDANRKGAATTKPGATNNSNSATRKPDGNRGKATGNNKTEAARPVIEINSANFPPLSSEDTPVPTPGYKDTYLKYSFEEIISIVKEVKEATLPASINTSSHPFALTTTPNLDLLKKQRTYSIDETREQLRQGRPVHREAITAGAVDMRSLAYGDESQQAPAAVPSVPAAVAATAQPAVEAAAPVAAATPSKAPSGTRSRGNSHDHTHNQTPKKISASTWAAMVKSSAAAVATETAASSAVKAAPASAVKESAEKKAAATAATPSKDTKATDKKKSSTAKEGSARPSTSEGGRDGTKRGERKKPAPKEGAEEKDAESVSATAGASAEAGEPAAADAASSTGAPTSPWGGKSSFASIVKLNADESGEASTSPVSPVKQDEAKKAAPTASSRASAGTSRSTRPSTAPKTGGAPREDRRSKGANQSGGSPDRTSARKSSSSATSGANASGIWVKETLPALSARK